MGDWWENITFQHGFAAANDPFNWFGWADKKDEGAEGPPAAADTGAVVPESIEVQAAQRRLARLSKYFTSPTGVLNDSNTGSSGVF